MMRILLIEDDDTIAEPLTRGLGREGYDVRRVGTAAQALAASDFDFVLLDLGLPDRDGRDVCRELRERTDVPIIVVTARSDEVERVLLLDLGADDYIVKPFGLRELTARIRAVSRRAAPMPERDGPFVVGDLTIEPRTRRCTLDGKVLELTQKEFDLLAYLASAPDVVHRRQHILEAVWDTHWYGPTKTLDVHVAALRKKLGDPRWIETVRGVGFRLVAPGDVAEP